MIRAEFKGGPCDGVVLAMAIPRTVPELLYLARISPATDWMVVATEETREPPASIDAVIYGLDREGSGEIGLGPGVGYVGNVVYRPVSEEFAAAVREALS